MTGWPPTCGFNLRFVEPIVECRRNECSGSSRSYRRLFPSIGDSINMADDVSPWQAEDYEDVLVDWLRLNDFQERLSEELFKSRFDLEATDAFLNQIDELRSAVVARTKQLLSRKK
jgi:hypothetical protein